MFRQIPLTERLVAIPELVSFAALNNSNLPFAHLVNEQTCEAITWRELGHDVETVTRYLESSVKPNSERLRIAILAGHGYSYAVHVLAIIMKSWVVVPLSPRNTPDIVDELLQLAGADYLLQDSDRYKGKSTTPVIQFHFHGKRPQSLLLLRNVVFPPDKVEKLIDEPAYLVHTTGTTDRPKLITWTYRYCLAMSRVMVKQFNSYRHCASYCMAPYFHAMGALNLFAVPVTIGTPSILPFNPGPLNGLDFLAQIRHFTSTIVWAIPSLLDEIHQCGNETIEELAHKSSVVFFGGAPLNPSVGDLLVAKGVYLRPLYGSTETNMVSCVAMLPNKEDWQYFRLRDGYEYSMVDVPGEDANVQELIVLPAEDSPAVLNSQIPLGYRTGDLFVRHPTFPDHLKHVGRKADVLVLNNGLKVNQQQIVKHVLNNRDVRYAMVFGGGRNQIGILVDPVLPNGDTSSFRRSLWKSVEACNRVMPTYARIVRDLIIVTTPELPVVLSDKRTLKPRETLLEYTKIIDAAYTQVSKVAVTSNYPDGLVLEEITQFLTVAVTVLLDHNLAMNDDFFNNGMDSLHTASLRATVAALLEHFDVHVQLLPNVIYQHPSIELLARFIMSCATGHPSTEITAKFDSISTIIDQQTSQLKTSPSTHVRVRTGKLGTVVAITGSTGNLGAFLLRDCLSNPTITRIICLNRVHKGISHLDRQKRCFIEKGMDPADLITAGTRLAFLDLDLSKPHLGLTKEDYIMCQTEVTHFFHAAWRLDFNMELSSYLEPHVIGVTNIINMIVSNGVKIPAQLIFFSSIAASQGYRGDAPIPAEYIDLEPPTGGYGQSKYVAERILRFAEQHRGLRLTVYRVGQLSGAIVNGFWSRTEYIPILLASSLSLKLVPTDLPPVTWLPVDRAAKLILNKVFADDFRGGWLNLTGSQVVPWSNIVSTFRAIRPDISPVLTETWLNAVRDSATELDATRLSTFYSELAKGSGYGSVIQFEVVSRGQGELDLQDYLDKILAYIEANSNQ